MAIDKRIDQLSAVIPVMADLMAIYDTSSPGTKKITLAQLVSLISASAGENTIWVTATDSDVISDARLVGREVKLVLVGGLGSGEIITTGTPISNQLLFNTLAGTLQQSYNFIDGEIITIKYL